MTSVLRVLVSLLVPYVSCSTERKKKTSLILLDVAFIGSLRTFFFVIPHTSPGYILTVFLIRPSHSESKNMIITTTVKTIGKLLGVKL